MRRLFLCWALVFCSSLFAAPLDLLQSKAASSPVSAIEPITTNAELVRLNQRLELAQAQLNSLDSNHTAPDRDNIRFWLTLQIYAHQQHIAALTGLDALKNQAPYNLATDFESNISNRVQLQQERRLTEQEINVLSNSLKVQETYLKTIHEELEQAQAELRLNQAQFEKTASSSSQRSQMAQKIALSQQKVNTWLATLASIDIRQQFSRARLQNRRELVLALNARIDNGNDNNQLQTEVLDANLQAIHKQQASYRQQQQEQLHREQTLSYNLATLKQQLEALKSQLDDPKAKHKEQLQTQAHAIEQQESVLLQQLETHAIHSGILTDLMMANTLEGNFWQRRQALEKNGSQISISPSIKKSIIPFASIAPTFLAIAALHAPVI